MADGDAVSLHEAKLLIQEIDDMIECSICCQVFTEPKSLPCLHTFCKVCLQQAFNDRPKIPCRLCRKECLRPSDGVHLFESNFFIENLINTKKVSTALHNGSEKCALCAALNEDTTPAAVAYCGDCKQFYCDRCRK